MFVAVLLVTGVFLGVAGAFQHVARIQKAKVYELVDQGLYDEALRLDAGAKFKIKVAERMVLAMGQVNAFIIFFSLLVMLFASRIARERDKVTLLQLNPKFPIPPASIING